MLGIILWIAWIYSIYQGFSNRRFVLSGIVLVVGVLVNFTPIGPMLGIAALPLWILPTVVLLVMNKFDSAKRTAGWMN